MSVEKHWRIKAKRIDGVICYQVEQASYMLVVDAFVDTWEHYTNFHGPRVFRTYELAEKALKDMLAARKEIDDIPIGYYSVDGDEISQ